MQGLFHLVQNVDLFVYYWLSRFHGNWYLDRFVAFQESNALLKCGVLTSMYWYFWFREGNRQREMRRKILIILTGTFTGLVLTRMVATIMPFRVRPLYAVGIQHSPLSIPAPTGFMDWSSFPSDHAAYLCALGFGLVLLSRRFIAPVALFLAGWVCVPRMYLGIHYASDLLVGAAIGAATVWLALKAKWLESAVARPVLTFAETKPQFFYTLAFLGMFEMTTLFWDIQSPVHAGLHLISRAPHHRVIEAGLVLLISVCGVLAYLYRVNVASVEKKIASHALLSKAARAGRP